MRERGGTSRAGERRRWKGEESGGEDKS